MIHWEKSSASSISLEASDWALFCSPHPYPTWWKPRQWMCNGWIIHLTFSNLIEQSIHIQIDWKLCKSATIRSISAYVLSIYNNSNLWYRVISSTDPPLFGAKMMKGQRVNRRIWSIRQFIWNFVESGTIRAISACLLSIYAMRKGIWLWSKWKNEQPKEWTYQWTNEQMNE